MKISLSFKEKFIILSMVFMGLILRLVWDSHQTVWSYDQARDSFVVRELVRNLDLILVGPQTEYYGLFHGPLYYYFTAPFYAISRGETALPLLATSLVVYSAAIPLSILAKRISKNNVSGLITFGLFTASYAFIEYSRWLSNFVLAIPFLGWGYLLLFSVLEGKANKWTLFLLGVSLGFAIQAEIFFVTLALAIFTLFVITKKSKQNILLYVLGGVVGVLPLIISEIKFGFRGVGIILEVLGKDLGKSNLGQSFLGYIKHLGITSHFLLGGKYMLLNILIIVFILFCFIYIFRKSREVILLTVVVLVSHFLLFLFTYVDAVFLDLGLSVFLIVVTGVMLYKIFSRNKFLFLTLCVVFVLSQIDLYKAYLVGSRPFNNYKFIQEPSTLLSKEEVVEAIYNHADGKPFTFASFGTPFGVRTVWASVFELYARENSLQIPNWYGYFANGYPGEGLFEIAERPERLHVVLLESNLSGLVPEPIVREHMGNQDTHTRIIEEITVNDTVIQFREPK